VVGLLAQLQQVVAESSRLAAELKSVVADLLAQLQQMVAESSQLAAVLKSAAALA
jgi:DNA anti-recombination protein RmuC